MARLFGLNPNTLTSTISEITGNDDYRGTELNIAGVDPLIELVAAWLGSSFSEPRGVRGVRSQYISKLLGLVTIPKPKPSNPLSPLSKEKREDIERAAEILDRVKGFKTDNLCIYTVDSIVDRIR